MFEAKNVCQSQPFARNISHILEGLKDVFYFFTEVKTQDVFSLVNLTIFTQTCAQGLGENVEIDSQNPEGSRVTL